MRKRQLTAVAYRNICVSKSTDIGGTLYAKGNTEGSGDKNLNGRSLQKATALGFSKTEYR